MTYNQNKKLETALIIIVKKSLESNKINMLKLSVQYPDVNFENYKNDIYNKHDNIFEIIELLMKHPDIDIYIKDSDGYGAMDYAKAYNNKNIISLLLQPTIHKLNNGIY